MCFLFFFPFWLCVSPHDALCAPPPPPPSPPPQTELAASEAKRADLTAQARAAAMSLSSVDALKKMAEEGGESSPAAIVQRIKEQFEEEMEAVRAAHDEEVAVVKRRMEEQVLSQRMVAEEAASKLSETELEFGNVKDELLEAYEVRANRCLW